MWIRGTFVDCPDDPFEGGTLRSCAALRVENGAIAERADSVPSDVDDVVDADGGLVIPGLVDLHVHFPQIRVMGALGRPLLEWLDADALPEEQRMAQATYAREVADEFLAGLLGAGTTTALVFGSHFPVAMEEFFAAASGTGLRITSGLVVADRRLPGPLLTTPERAQRESLELADRWHGQGRLRYAVTPRFAYSASPELLDACGEALSARDGLWFTSHLNENHAEIAQVEADHHSTYTGAYDRAGLLGRHSVLAHNVHPSDPELDVLASRGSSVAHCPCSNAALASGLFPMRRHLDAGVRFGLGSDVGAGTGFSILSEALQAAFIQNLSGGVTLAPAHLLWLATRAGALALDLPDVGSFEVGQRFDAAWYAPDAAAPLGVCLRHASCVEDAVGKLVALGTPADLAGVWIDGDRVR